MKTAVSLGDSTVGQWAVGDDPDYNQVLPSISTSVASKDCLLKSVTRMRRGLVRLKHVLCEMANEC